MMETKNIALTVLAIFLVSVFWVVSVPKKPN